MKIPTLVGIAVIISLIASLGYWFFIRQNPKPAINIEVSDLQVVNVTDTTATVVWQTNLPAIGQVNYAQFDNLNQSASDNRDYAEPSERLTHFITLKNLAPNTKYSYRVSNSGFLFPEKSENFQTANISSQEELDFSYLKPLKGTILNSGLNPIDESLIFLEIENAQSLATFSSTAGNFVMPLKLVLNKELNKIFNVPENTPATLTIKKGKIESKVKVLISETSVNLPPIALGTNLDLTKYVSPIISTINIGPQTQGGLDYNNDGIVNSLDLAILRGKAVTGGSLSAEDKAKFDINSDGLIDQKDITEFSNTVLNQN